MLFAGFNYFLIIFFNLLFLKISENKGEHSPKLYIFFLHFVRICLELGSKNNLS